MTFDPDFRTDLNRWQAVIQRGAQAYSKFVYAVTTTSIYCRPTCSSRKPNRKNVRFFDNWRMAEENGFRPCKRCKPQMNNAPDPKIETVIQACKIIEEAEHEQSLNELSDSAGLSPYHFHRTFKRVLGVTPKQYAMEIRLKRMRKNLPQSSTITEAVYESGYESSSRFYEKAAKSLGMKPSAYKKGGKGKTIHYAIIQSYLGWVLVAATEKGICRIDFADAPQTLHDRITSEFPEAKLHENDSDFKTIVEKILKFLETPEQGAPLPLDIQGTAFQRRVWTALQKIPPGSTVNYGEIAKQIGKPKAARAVAQACAANQIAVAIPCHRVVRSDGDLGGYRWGVSRKQAILSRELTKSE